MHGKPDGGWFCACVYHPVSASRGEPGVIARSQLPGSWLAFDLEMGFTLDHEHPFVPVLVVPVVGWADMTLGNNTFYAHAWGGEQVDEGFLWSVCRG